MIHTIIKYRKDFYAICNCCPRHYMTERLSIQHDITKDLIRKNSIAKIFKVHQPYEYERAIIKMADTRVHNG